MANELNDLFAWHIARLRKIGVVADGVSIMTSYGVGTPRDANWSFWTVFVGKEMVSGCRTWSDVERQIGIFLQTPKGKLANKKLEKGPPRGTNRKVN